jgi:hypothetical protein
MKLLIVKSILTLEMARSSLHTKATLGLAICSSMPPGRAGQSGLGQISSYTGV